SRPRLERRLALLVVARDEATHPALGHPVGAGDLCLGPSLDDDGGDDETGTGHARASSRAMPISRDTPFLCLEIEHCRGRALPGARGAMPPDVPPMVASDATPEVPARASL